MVEELSYKTRFLSSPMELARAGTEHAHQRALFAWAARAEKYGIVAAGDPRAYSKGGKDYIEKWYGTVDALPALKLLHAIPNGGQRNKAVAAKLKAEGVKPGIPDVNLPVARGQYIGLYIEMKKPTHSYVRDEQTEKMMLLQVEGHYVAVCRTWREAVDTILGYLALGVHHAQKG